MKNDIFRINKKIIFVLFNILLINNLYSQRSGNNTTPWSIGFGLNAIDDSGNALTNPFNFDDNYHFSKPFRLFVEKRFENEIGIELALVTNTFEVGKKIGNRVLERSINYFAIDAALKYYVSNVISSKYRSYFEIYLFAGLGRSYYDDEGLMTFNGGPGLTFYITKNLRLFAQPSAKIPIKSSIERTKFIQYDIGLIYGIPW